MKDSNATYGKNSEKKQYILGRKENLSENSLNIGRYYALDSSLGANVNVDVLHPHIILICGKRGYGKSHTMGVFIEEISRLNEDVKKNLGVVVIDTLGIFWTSQFPIDKDNENLKKWGYLPDKVDINLLVPKKAIDEYKSKNIDANSFSIRVSELSPYHWCHLFNIKLTDPFGIALTRAVIKLQSFGTNYSISDLKEYILNDDRSDVNVKGIAENFLSMADSWGIFDKEGVPIDKIVKRGCITVLDVSHLQDTNLKIIVTSIIGKKIFEERVKERKMYEQKKMGLNVEEKGMPMVWLAMDEAQLFLPNNKHVLSKDTLINEWMRQGRQPGLSLVMATQRPSALDPEVLSHCDMIICHRITAHEDIDTFSKIRPTYMSGDIKESIKKIGDEKGVALVIDDTSESIHIIKIRPRFSWHGGSEPLAIDEH